MQVCDKVWKVMRVCGGKKARREGARGKKAAIYGEFFLCFSPRDIYVVGFLGISYSVENLTIHEL